MPPEAAVGGRVNPLRIGSRSIGVSRATTRSSRADASLMRFKFTSDESRSPPSSRRRRRERQRLRINGHQSRRLPGAARRERDERRLAMAGVSAVLAVLSDQPVHADAAALFGGAVKVSRARPRPRAGTFTPGSPENQVNLFLHQVTHNVGWRNQDLPSVGPDGRTRLSNPPLALDLHYLLTAYGSDDWQAEALLGFALLMLHENPVLTRNDISTAIAQLPIDDASNPLSTPLGTVGLADQIEMLKITPATLGREEMAWLWTALKADYRPTFPFQVSVVLIEPKNPRRSPAAGAGAQDHRRQPDPRPFPAIIAVAPAAGQPAATLGTSSPCKGHHLTGRDGCRAEQLAARHQPDARRPLSLREYLAHLHAARSRHAGRTGRPVSTTSRCKCPSPAIR